jgi:hypothetical protein
MIWNKEVSEEYNTAFCDVYLKQIRVCNAESWITTKRNRNKIHAVDMEIFRGIEG